MSVCFFPDETCSPLIATRDLEELLDDASSESEASQEPENDIEEPPRDDESGVGQDPDAGNADAEVGVPDGNYGGGDS